MGTIDDQIEAAAIVLIGAAIARCIVVEGVALIDIEVAVAVAATDNAAQGAGVLRVEGDEERELFYAKLCPSRLHSELAQLG